MQINSILINLPKRTERLEHSRKELTKFFGEFKTVVSNAVSNLENTTLAIRESHKNCIRYANETEQKNILIIEDDICLRENSKPYFDELLENLPSDFDVLIFGCYSGKVIDTDDKYWNKIQKFAGCHFYIVNERAYQTIIDYNGTEPIDHYIGKNLNVYISKKHFAYQLDGWSDNAKCVTKYNQTNLSLYKKYFF
jgi:GR25 family glycosyltransferase involved in LPS biosynthesis